MAVRHITSEQILGSSSWKRLKRHLRYACHPRDLKDLGERDVTDYKNHVYVSGKGEPELVEEILNHDGLVCITGTKGSGKSAFVSRLIIDANEDNVRSPPVLFPTIDFTDLNEAADEALSRANGDGDDAEKAAGDLIGLVVEEVRVAIRNAALKAYPDRMAACMWMRRKLAEALFEKRHPFSNQLEAWRPEIDAAVMDDGEVPSENILAKRLRDEEDRRMSRLFLGSLIEKFSTHDIARFLVETDRHAGVVVVFDNVDELRNGLQTIMMNVLNSICKRGGEHVMGLIALREENAISIGRTSSGHSLETVKVKTLPLFAESEGDDEFDVPLFRPQEQAQKKPFLIMARRALRGLRETLAAAHSKNVAEVDRSDLACNGCTVECQAARILMVLVAASLKNKVADHAYSLANHNIRDLRRIVLAFIEHTIKQGGILDREEFVASRTFSVPSDVKEDLTSDFYLWLTTKYGEAIPTLSIPGQLAAHDANVNCFPYHLILAFLQNRKERGGGGRLVSRFEIQKTMKKLGWSGAEVNDRLHRLHRGPRGRGHMIEARHPDPNRPFKATEPHDQDEFWILPRGTVVSKVIPYRFFSIYGGLCNISRNTVDGQTPDERVTMVLSFLADVVPFLSRGLLDVRRCYASEPGNWTDTYLSRFGIVYAGHMDLQFDRIVNDLTHFFESQRWHGAAEHLEIIERLWRTARNQVFAGQIPAPRPRHEPGLQQLFGGPADYRNVTGVVFDYEEASRPKVS